MKKIYIGIVVVLAILVSSGVYFIGDLLFYARHPLTDDGKETVVTVIAGKDVGTIARQLKQEGIISNPGKFKLFARIKGYDKRIKAGEYALSPAMSPEVILQTIVSGKVRLHRITIPEGYNLKQIAGVIEKSALLTSSEFIRAAVDTDLLKKEGIMAESFEGYLFPDTYYFPKGVNAEGIISALVKRFRSVYTDDWKQQSERLGYSIHEIVTMASIIEKETGARDERPLISSVFHNRMRKGMRLESDPTVIYGIKDFQGNITRKHLSTPTPYNTYTRKGLPPGPIANPGKAAIEAALYPADTEYLYFVSKGDGSHHFSTRIEDHNRAVRKYQLRR